MVNRGHERERERERGNGNHSLKDPFGEWVLCHIGDHTLKKGKHTNGGDLQVSQSICGGER